ncbi:hypothetical protein VTK73DRAFT_1652 [Phialemonium thermophilum]|uniref:Uncharacterized protein n=1 Tax=Phialemonium thermophilum TaxID=223376 RepID=A0ABR3VT70_9PEZI
MGGTKAATAAITTTTATIVHAGGGVQFTSARLDRVFSNPMPPPAGVEQDRLLPVEEALAARDGPPSSAARQAAAALGPRSKPSSSTVSPLRPPPAAPASTSTARSTRPSASADTGGEIRVMRDSSDSTSSIEPIATMFQQYIREQYGPSRRDSTPRQGRTSPAVPSPSGQWDQHNTVDLSGPATGGRPVRLYF